MALMERQFEAIGVLRILYIGVWVWHSGKISTGSLRIIPLRNFAILRHITLNLLKQEKSCKRSIAGKRLLAGWDTNYREKILFQGKGTFPG